jgi:hypothetical protein
MALRVGYGAGLLAAPTAMTRRWLGPSAQSAPTQIPVQALGMREVVLHVGIIAVALRGGPLRPWLAGSFAGDLTDVAATVARHGGLPDDSARATALVGGGSALVSAALLAAVDC